MELLRLERGNRCLQGVLPVCKRFLNCFTVGQALREIRVGNKKASAFLGLQRTHLKRIVDFLSHDSCSFNELQELPDVDRLDGTPGRHGERLAYRGEHH